MTNGKVSVIIPVFRTEEYLEKCIDSVMSQTYDNIEIILVDDGSDDNCPEICDRYAVTDSRIKVIHKKNGGLSDARNAGIENADGEYLAFVDSDDFVEPDIYEKLVHGMENCDISVCGYYSVSGEKVKEHTAFNEQKIFSAKEALKELFEDERIKNHVWNKLFRRELFSGIAFPCSMTFEDILTTYKLFEKSNSIKYIPYSGYYYTDREGSISKNNDSKTCFARYTAHLLRYEDIKKRMPEYDAILLRQLFIQARAYMLSAHESGSTEKRSVTDFFKENEEHIKKSARLGFVEKKQLRYIAEGKRLSLKLSELFRKTEKLLKKIFERRR